MLFKHYRFLETAKCLSTNADFPFSFGTIVDLRSLLDLIKQLPLSEIYFCFFIPSLFSKDCCTLLVEICSIFCSLKELNHENLDTNSVSHEEGLHTSAIFDRLNCIESIQ